MFFLVHNPPFFPSKESTPPVRAPPSRRSKKEHRFDAHGEAAQVVINPSGEKFNSTTGGAYEKG